MSEYSDHWGWKAGTVALWPVLMIVRTWAVLSVWRIGGLGAHYAPGFAETLAALAIVGILWRGQDRDRKAKDLFCVTAGWLVVLPSWVGVVWIAIKLSP